MGSTRRFIVFMSIVGLLLAACGDDRASSDGGDGADGRPTVVATTNLLGDVLESFAGEQVDVVTIMPVGADPHDFQASAQQANQIREADVLIANGAGFEAGLVDVIDAAAEDGTATFEAVDAVETIDFGEGGHRDEEGDHTDEEDHEGADPHFFTDPARMAMAVDATAEFLIENVDGIDAEALRASADEYVAELEALDAEVEATLADIPDESRVLVTNHEVFGYFADRYGFEVVGTVIPGGSTTDGASAAELTDLADTIEAESVPAIFADTSSSEELSDTLAAEVGDIAVVELFSESLGEEGSGGETYVTMVRTNSERIAEALG